MIGHEYPAMNRHVKSLSALRQPVGVSRKICVTGENSLPVEKPRHPSVPKLPAKS